MLTEGRSPSQEASTFSFKETKSMNPAQQEALRSESAEPAKEKPQEKKFEPRTSYTSEMSGLEVMVGRYNFLKNKIKALTEDPSSNPAELADFQTQLKEFPARLTAALDKARPAIRELDDTVRELEVQVNRIPANDENADKIHDAYSDYSSAYVSAQRAVKEAENILKEYYLLGGVSKDEVEDLFDRNITNVA